MRIKTNLEFINKQIPNHVTLVAVSKTKPIADVQEAYNAGQRIFGENKVQELCEKFETLPKDIEWHMIGHLQRNKVKYIAPFVQLIHGVDNEKLATEINKQAKNNNRIIDCLVQIHLGEEETKFGFSFDEAAIFLENYRSKYSHINVKGLMAMGTFTSNSQKTNSEFKKMSDFYKVQETKDSNLTILSMGMSGDFQIAINNSSNMVRIGSTIFGNRTYQ